jgi:hypothetical protein
MNEISNRRNQDGFSTIGIVIIVIIVAAGLAVFIVFRGENKEAIKIGAILPLTGVGEKTAIEARDGRGSAQGGD